MASARRLEDVSDLGERDLVGICVAVNVEDEGVFVGVVLDDVVVHVDQDAEEGDDWSVSVWCVRGECWAASVNSPFFTFLVHFGYPLRGHAILLRYLQTVRSISEQGLAAKRSFSVGFGHLQHPSSLWAWETSTSARQTPHPSLFERTAVLWRRQESDSIHFTFGLESHKGNGSASTNRTQS